MIGGEDVGTMTGATLRQFRTDVQAVFQGQWASLSPRMRVFDIVAEALVINDNLTKSELKHRVDEALTAVGLRPRCFHPLTDHEPVQGPAAAVRLQICHRRP